MGIDIELTVTCSVCGESESVEATELGAEQGGWTVEAEGLPGGWTFDGDYPLNSANFYCPLHGEDDEDDEDEECEVCGMLLEDCECEDNEHWT